MSIALEIAAINLSVALGCGALIGSERQVRQRMAGLRTNALVALGAAAFVVFAALYPDEVSPTRVAAQVVSGIGFLGAGIIFRDGFNVHGLNTAATLWCSAAVGLLAGAGALPFAVLMTGLVVFVNLGLRPLVKLIKRTTKAGQPVLRQFQMSLTCRTEQEGPTRALALRTLAVAGLHIAEIRAGTAPEGGVALSFTFSGTGMTDAMLEQALQRIAAEPGLMHVSWRAVEDG